MMKSRILKVLFAACIAVTTTLQQSCLKDDLDYSNVPQAGFTMINLYDQADGIIHKADNNYIQAMNSPLQYKGINFVYLYPGNRRIQTLSLNGNVLLDSVYTIKDSLLYTSVVFSKPNATVGQLLIEDQLVENLEDSQVALRFFNLAKSNITADVFVDNTQLVDDRTFDGIPTSNHDKFDFVKASATAQKIIVKNQQDEVVAEKELKLNARRQYSIFLINKEESNTYEILIFEQYRL